MGAVCFIYYTIPQENIIMYIIRYIVANERASFHWIFKLHKTPYHIYYLKKMLQFYQWSASNILDIKISLNNKVRIKTVYVDSKTRQS